MKNLKNKLKAKLKNLKFTASDLKQSLNGFVLMLTGECFEELFESLIEAGLINGMTWIFSNAVTNVIFLFGAVQLSKTLIKRFIMVIIKPIIKKITYKEGNDKVKGFVNLLQKISDNLATNPITFGGITFDGAVVGALAYLISNILMPILPVWAVALITVFICLVVFLVILYFVHTLYEKPVCKEDRLKLKEERKVEKEAKALNDKLIKDAKKQAEKEEKEKKDAEYQELIQQKMNEIKLAEQQKEQEN